jgi:hypothetical protein
MWTCAFCLFPMSPLPDTEESPDMLLLTKNKNLETEINNFFYATLAYIRHFIFAGCYDNDPWYLVTNLAGH